MRSALLACLLAGAAWAAPPPGVTVYPAAYFADAAPANAADMLARLPGFTLVDADEDVRGYAAAQGNVLIDGARPASKRESLDDLLERIPAHAVERIELVRAGTPGYDLLGQAMVANVVRRPLAAVEGAVEAHLLADADGGFATGIEAEATHEVRGRRLELAAASVPELEDDSGSGRRRRFDTDGTLEGDEAIAGRELVRASQASANYTQPLGAGESRTFAALRDTRVRERTRIGAEDNDERETLQETELALRYARELDGDGAIEALASQRSGRGNVHSEEREEDEVEVFRQSTHALERIARLDWRGTRSPRLALNASAEFAFNALDGDASLVEDGEAADLPGSRVRIDERRAEVALGAQWRVADDWRLESGVGMERSRLRQRGDTPLQREFVYVKPRLAARWQRSASETWRLALVRDVSQLDFEDFVATASLDGDVVSAGNARLQPDRAWRLELSRETRFGRDGALALTAAHERIDDVIDRVPVFAGNETFDAPGNIGAGCRDSLALAFGTSLDALGAPSLRLDAEVVWQRTRVTDPVTGLRREISGEAPLEGEIALAQALPERGIEWGVEVELGEREREYRFDETATERSAAAWEVFVERRVAARWRWRAAVSTARDIEERRDGVEGRELREHAVPAQVLLSLRREMGG